MEIFLLESELRAEEKHVVSHSDHLESKGREGAFKHFLVCWSGLTCPSMV